MQINHMVKALCVVSVLAAAWSANLAFAIDCGRARTQSEVAICTNPALKAFDEYLDAAYAAVRKIVPPEMFREVRRDQIRWIKDRDAKCLGSIPCLMNEAQARTASLNGFAQRYAESQRFRSTSQAPVVVSPSSSSPGRSLSPTEIYRRAASSVVVIVGFDPSTQGVSQGSGVVIAQDLVATNCHVVDGSEAIAVLFRNSAYRATVVAGNKSLDFCVVKTSGLPARPADVAGLDLVTPGQRAYSVGSPRGLELTIAEGLVSGIRKQEGYPLPLIQTSAPISPGSSGGGLFDEFGRVIGITTFHLKDSQNLNFALPVEMSRHVLRR